MKKNLLTLLDLDPSSFEKILNDTSHIKKKNEPGLFLTGKNIGLIFEKPSTRTRVSSEVAVSKLGGNPIYLSASELQLNRGESVKDTARVLSRYLDGIIIRTRSHEFLEDFVKYGTIPVINALSDKAHPLQAIADFYTVKENGYDLNQFKMCFLGDGQNNVCRSLMTAFVFFKGNLAVASHPDFFPDEKFLSELKSKGANIEIYSDVKKAVKDADSLYTDVWISMGQEEEAAERKAKLQEYQLNTKMIDYSGKNPILLHCLPAHKELEITSEAFESENSRIFDQAENRLHSLMAVLKHIYLD